MIANIYWAFDRRRYYYTNNLPCFTVITTLWGGYYRYSHFTDGDPEAQRGRPHIVMVGWDVKPTAPNSLCLPVFRCPKLSQGLGIWGLRYPWQVFLLPFLFFFFSLSLPLPATWSPPDADRAVKEREIGLCVSLNTRWRPDACHLSPSATLPSTSSFPGPLHPTHPHHPLQIPCHPPHLTLHLESEDVRASNRVSAEVIDSSHRENSPAFSVNGAEPESWRGERDV